MDAKLYKVKHVDGRIMYTVYFRLDYDLCWEPYYNGEDEKAALSVYNGLLKVPVELIFSPDINSNKMN